MAKIARANQQLDALEAEIAAAPDYSDSITFEQKFDPGASAIEIALQGVPKLPLEFGLLAAEPMQNLRAAINYLAWELAKWNLAQQGEEREPDGRTQYPINTRASGVQCLHGPRPSSRPHRNHRADAAERR
jgi:hypothetical protein